MLANIARRSIDEAHGSAAIEFALVVPVLLLLVVGAMEIGMIIYTHSAAGFATRDVARRIATNRLVVTLAPSTVKDQLPAWVRQDTTVTVDQSTPSNIFTNQITVKASFPAAKATPTNVLNALYGSSTIEVQGTIQQEPAL